MSYRPALLTALRAGYGRAQFLADLLAGVTVALVALPLAMAFGIASIPADVAADLAARGSWLTPPALGLYTAIVAGFLGSLLGGSRVQISGPTGAFIVIVYGVAARHGYDGLATAGLLAGGMLLVMGACRFGAINKFIPHPVITGFTAGIAGCATAGVPRETQPAGAERAGHRPVGAGARGRHGGADLRPARSPRAPARTDHRHRGGERGGRCLPPPVCSRRCARNSVAANWRTWSTTPGSSPMHARRWRRYANSPAADPAPLQRTPALASAASARACSSVVGSAGCAR